MQTNIFELTRPKYKITKPIRLIELFAGIGSQAKALKNIGANFEHYKVIEFDKYAIKSYNAIHNTNFITQDITKIKAKDLGIVNTKNYEYILTYSFPCQDLSIAGKLKGMKKEDNTRSGLLWEVERLLNECEELPQVLLMENVPQVIGKKNIQDFHKWQLFLEKLGYSNYVDLLNAKNYGIPQNRNRCFMVSILGDYYYEFPKKQKLKLRLKDMLEDEVDEKYYLNEEQIKKLKGNTFNSANRRLQEKNYSDTLLARDYKDPKVIQVARYDTSTRINSSRYRTYSKEGISPTLTSMGGGNLEPHIFESIVCEQRTDEGLRFFKGDVCGALRIIDACGDKRVLIPQATKKGYAIAHAGDGVYIDRPHQKRGVVQKGMIQTLKTSGDDVGVVVKNNNKNINDENNVFSTLGTNCGSSTSAGGGVVVTNNYSNNNDVDTKGDILGVAINHPYLKIRKLTPKECWRLMGFDDEDFEKAENVNSNAQLYKQAGNSIVVNVLEKIFKNLF